MVWFLAALLLLASPAISQTKAAKRKAPAKKTETTAAEPRAWPIESMKVEGNRLHPERDILALTGLKIGQPAGKPEFEAARARLVDTGAFESVGFRFAPAPDGKGYAAVFEVAEIAQVYPYQFEDLPAAVAELRSYLKKKMPFFGDKIPGTKAVTDQFARTIEEFLAAKGKPQKVAGKVVAEGPDQLSILFRPATPPPAVADVRFTGNQVISSPLLRNAITGVAVGTVYREALFRQLLDTSVRPLYDARGRIRVAFPTLKVERAKDVTGVVVTVEVSEGPSYNLGDVTIEGSSVPSGTLYKAADFKTGDLANFQAIDAGIERALKRVRRNGYMQARATPERKINDQKKIVDLVIRIEPGPQYVFGNLTLDGLDLHGEAAIKKLWALKPGQPYDGDYPEFFLDRVREAGLFDNLGQTRPVVKVDEQNHTVDVTLVFRGEGLKKRAPGEGRRGSLPALPSGRLRRSGAQI